MYIKADCLFTQLLKYQIYRQATPIPYPRLRRGQPDIQTITLQIITKLFRHAHVFTGVQEEDFWFLVVHFKNLNYSFTN
jgi:hypothetical protein